MRFHGVAKVVCAYCLKAKGFAINADPETMKAAPGHIERSVQKAFDLLDKGVRELSWTKEGDEWFCKACTETRAQNPEPTEPSGKGLGFTVL